MKKTVLIGGKAGQGLNLIMNLLSEALLESGFYVFASRDYQSLIRGGHNFNILTFSDNKVYSNESKADILVCLDENTENLHKKELKKDAIIIKPHAEGEKNIYFAASAKKNF